MDIIKVCESIANEVEILPHKNCSFKTVLCIVNYQFRFRCMLIITVWQLHHKAVTKIKEGKLQLLNEAKVAPRSCV